MKKIFVLIAVFFLMFDAWQARADEGFQDFFNNCTYGMVTGVLIGGASLALAEDPGSNLSPITKGASLGLYAGAMVSVYKNWYKTRRARIDIGKENSDNEKSSESIADSIPEFMVMPQNQGLAVAFRWRL
jgi:hypothetical protein